LSRYWNLNISISSSSNFNGKFFLQKDGMDIVWPMSQMLDKFLVGDFEKKKSLSGKGHKRSKEAL
jgi:hypothetical protein